jgi:hypothetical protein
MPREYSEMPCDVLLVMANTDNHDASSERLIREIMSVDGVTREDAKVKADEMDKMAQSGASLWEIPWRGLAVVSLVGGLATFPLCFDLSTALWFNDAFVTTDVPPDEDLETWLEVGSWTWNWMEPPLGQLSFLLLTIQTASSLTNSIKEKQVTFKTKRAENLANKFPQYDHVILAQFATTA